MSFVVSLQGRHLALVVGLGLALPVLYVPAAFAQANPGGGSGGGGGGGGSTGGGGGGSTGGGGSGTGGGGGGASTGGTSTMVQGPTTYQTYPGGVAPTAPGQTLGGGNAQYSSSKPITGNETDSFDFGKGGGGASVHGSDNSSYILGSGSSGGDQVRPFNAPGVHLVRRGDTLWGICDGYFHNPYQWPRIWSYNPQIQNPHWIYPGDQVKLKSGLADVIEPAGPAAQATAPGSGFIDRRRQVPPETVFLRTQGYIEDEKNTNWGEISGSREDKMILTDFDEVYLRIAAERDVKIGQELTIWRPVKSVGGGKLIAIQGTVRVDQWNPKERVARGRIVESLDAIERGARIGPVERRFEVVPPVRNDADLEATVLTSVQAHVFYGANQVVFLDKGEEAGLKPGNRLLIIRKGDAWHQSFTNRSAVKRIALEDESPAAVENVPAPRSSEALPEEVQAELRVVNVRKKTATAIVTTSRVEIEVGDKAYARKGY